MILADISLPSRSGYDICEYVKTSGKYPQTRVVLTAGPVTPYDEARAQAVGADGLVRKPFEATLLLNAVQPLLEGTGKLAQPKAATPVPPPAASAASITAVPPVTVAATPAPVAATPVPVAAPRPIDREQVRAAVILALEACMINIIENVTDKVVLTLEAETRPALPQTRAAAAGQAEAQYRLGLLYARGHGVLADLPDAVAWYRRAAEQGHLGAQYQLSLIYQKGPGPNAEAGRWYQLAAERDKAAAGR